ncbi:MAG: ATP-binding cassette domain-containing protein [Bacteroidales bacterium]
MSERILKALMQLFAIIARPDSDANDRRKVVEIFLKSQLNTDLVEKYLLVYDEYFNIYQAKSGNTDKKRKSIAASSTKVLKICSDINAELTQKQKIVVLVRLLEFIKTEADITEQEFEFVSTVAESFNVPNQEYKELRDFVINKPNEIPETHNLLIINDDKNFTNSTVKHILAEGLSGQIKVINIHSVGMQMFRAWGVGEININGQLIHEDKVNFISSGSAIRSNKIKPIYYSTILSTYNVDKSKENIVFETRELVYKFKGGKIGLHPMNFIEESGNLVGIMGASGAGKSTLLNVLNGTYKPTEGYVMVNGIDIHNDKEGKLKGLIGHVSQDDLLIEELTVFQNLYYNAKLCFDNYTEEQIVEAVNEMLANLGLYEIRDMKVGNPLNKKISGGQRKRLNIALELIREPAILFLDEPTSGLSSRDSENIMDLLKELSLKGKLVFVVIHQPSSDIFKTFDKLMILDTGGYLIYYGDPVDSIIYFKERILRADWNASECPTCGNVNPEQVFNIIETNVIDEYGNPTPTRKFKPSEWYSWYNSYSENSKKKTVNLSESNIPHISFKVPNWFNQLKVFVTRDVLSKLSNTQYVLINLLEAPAIALFLAFIIKYWNVDVNNVFGYTLSENENLPVYLFMLVICAIFIGLTVSAEEIIADRRILKRESFLNLSRSSYLMSKVIILLVISGFQALVFVLIGNTILEIPGMYFSFWLIAFSTWFNANMLGLNISDSFKTAVTIYILIPFLVIPQIILSGIIVSFDKLNPKISNPKDIPLYGEIMVSRWAYEALAVHQFKSNTYEKLLYPYEKAMSQADYKKNYWIKTLTNKINSIDRNLSNIKDEKIREKVINDLKLIKNEITIESTFGKRKFKEIEKLELSKVNTSVLDNARDYLQTLNQFYIKIYNKASFKKDSIIQKMESTSESKEAFLLLKKHNYNDNLADFCRNSNAIDRIVEYDNRLYQKIDPIFQDPEYSFVRAHFYAPHKRLGKVFIDTFWMNIIVIWSITVIFYIALYFKWVKRSLDFMEWTGEMLKEKYMVLRKRREEKKKEKDTKNKKNNTND